MQFGIFTVSDITPDPTTGRTPTEAERIKAVLAIAQKAEEVGLDVFALGEHHNPPFFSSSPTTTLAYIAAKTEKHPAVDVHDADHHQRPGEDRRGLRDAAAPGRRPGRPDDGPRQHRPGLPLVRQGHPRRHRARRRELRPAAPAVARGRRELGGEVPHPAAGLHLHAAPARRRAAVRVARLDPQPADRRAGRVLRRRLLPQPHLLAAGAHPADGRVLPPPLRALRPRQRRPGDRRPRRAGVHAEEQPGRRQGVPALLRRRAGLRPRPVAGGVHLADPADRGQPAAGHRAHPRLPRLRRRLPAPAVPHRPRRPAAEDRARAAGPARRGGRAGAAQGVRGAQARPRARGADPRLAGRRRRRRQGRHRPRPRRRRHRPGAEEVEAR